jgi:beta-phosphoglucomutase
VICHTDCYHYAAWGQVCNELGLHFDEELANRLRGVGRLESFETILKSNNRVLSPEDMHRYTDRKNEVYCGLLENLTPDALSGDVRKTLDGVRAKGLKAALASSSKNAKLILQRIGLADFFDAVSDGTDVTKPKPDPEVFLVACGRLNVPARACVVVEDGRAGIEAASAAGMDSAAIGDAVHSPLATYRLARMSDLLGNLE